MTDQKDRVQESEIIEENVTEVEQPIEQVSSSKSVNFKAETTFKVDIGAFGHDTRFCLSGVPYPKLSKRHLWLHTPGPVVLVSVCFGLFAQ